MTLYTWPETLWVAQKSGPSINNQATANTLLGNSTLAGPGTFTLPANFFNYVGKMLRVKVGGLMTANGTTPGNFNMNLIFTNTVTASIAGPINIWSSPVTTANATQVTNSTWELEVIMTARAIGPSANVMAIAVITAQAVHKLVDLGQLVPATAPVTSTAFDGTVPQIMDIQAKWGTANANNNIQLLMGRIEALN